MDEGRGGGRKGQFVVRWTKGKCRFSKERLTDEALLRTEEDTRTFQNVITERGRPEREKGGGGEMQKDTILGIRTNKNTEICSMIRRIKNL